MLHRFFWSSLAFGDATTVFLSSTYHKCTVQIVEARFVALQVNVDAFFHALGSRQKSGVFRSVFPTMWKKNRCCSVSASVRVLLRLAKLKQIKLGRKIGVSVATQDRGLVFPFFFFALFRTLFFCLLDIRGTRFFGFYGRLGSGILVWVIV